jgi:acyl-[acyl-carrier-protein]-phospholipid O-acyltransferase / long-chain-fatty-acid--[acyl-carrier-protein] ligase
LDAIVMPNTLFTGLVDAAKRYGRRFVIAEDSTGARLTYGALIGRSLAIGRKLAAVTNRGEHVGVLLPNVNGLLVTMFGLFAFGRVPAMLNFSAGVKMMGAACSLAGVKVIVTSRAFIEVAELEKALATLERGRQVVFLEDVRDSLSNGGAKSYFSKTSAIP